MIRKNDRSSMRGRVRPHRFCGHASWGRIAACGCAAAALLFSAAGCSATGADESSVTSTAEVLEENASEKSAEYESFEEVAAAFDASALNLEYSKRDMDASFDESSATKITLSGDSVSVSGRALWWRAPR